MRAMFLVRQALSLIIAMCVLAACGSSRRGRVIGDASLDTNRPDASLRDVSMDSGATCACTTPPPPTCVGSQRRTFAAEGATCESSECTYPHQDEPCANGCAFGACAEECTPGYACPAGSTFHRDGAMGRCLFENLTPPAGSAAYCLYFDMGYLGYYWTGGGTCPDTARYAPSAGTGYCLWEDFESPPGARADCDEFESLMRLGFRWPCE